MLRNVRLINLWMHELIAASKAPAPVGEKNNGGVSLLGSLGSALADGQSINWQ